MQRRIRLPRDSENCYDRLVQRQRQVLSSEPLVDILMATYQAESYWRDRYPD